MVRVGQDLREHLVLCTDARMGSALGSADTYLKERLIHPNWRVLTAGEQPAIVSLLKCFKRAVTPTSVVSAENVDGLIKSAAVARKSEIANEIVGAKFGLSFERFIQIGKDRFPPDIFYGVLKEIEMTSLGAEFIIAGFIDGSNELYVCEQSGRVFPTEHFAAVGEGGYLATAALLRRGQNIGNSLIGTIYNVYEAKRAAEAIGSVGQLTLLTVVQPDGTVRKMSAAMQTWLTNKHVELGPKPVPTDLNFEGQMFDV